LTASAAAFGRSMPALLASYDPLRHRGERRRLCLVEGMETVLGDLAALGYDAEWHCIPAAAVGAPHIRDRVWLVGYPDSHGQPASAIDDEVAGLPSVAPYANGGVLREQPRGSRRKNRPGSPLAEFVGYQGATPDADSPRLQVGEGFACHDGEELASSLRDDWRLTEPAVCRADDGIPHRVDRIRALGNAVVPQIPELIGRAILASEQARAA
jgi:DNA (cytosine-5)-methyltransferase 1